MTWRLILLLIILALFAQPAACQGNLVKEGDFLSDTFWQSNSVQEAGLFSGDSQIGLTSGRLWRKDLGDGYFSQEIVGLERAGYYRLSGYVLVENPASIYLGLDIASPDGTGYRGIMERVTPQDGWFFMDHSFQATTATKVTLRAGGSFVGQILWDNIQLKRQETTAQELARQLQLLWDKHGYIYTGLIIDARGLRMQRGMSPRVIARDGRDIYGISQVAPEVLSIRGMAGYTRLLEQAVLHPLLSVNPEFPFTLGLVIPALEVLGPARTSVRISNEGADKILYWAQKYDFLKDGRVIFVID